MEGAHHVAGDERERGGRRGGWRFRTHMVWGEVGGVGARRGGEGPPHGVGCERGPLCGVELVGG